MRARAAIAAAAIALALAGCGSSALQLAPAQTVSTTPTIGNEIPTPKPRQSAPGAATPEQAVAAFASGYINWTAATVSARLTSLAAASVGQARSAMALAAAQTGADTELHRGGVFNTGAVEAVARLAGSSDRYVVVTRESTGATNTTAYQSLRPAWHVALATVRELASHRWVVSGWQPES